MSPRLYYPTGAMIRDAPAMLGDGVRSCHANDVNLVGGHHIHMDEVRPSLGNLDYRAYLAELDRLDPDTPLILEHLKTAEEYAFAADYIRGVAARAGLAFKAGSVVC